MKKVLLIIIILAVIAAPLFAEESVLSTGDPDTSAEDYVKADDIQEVNLGDTFNDVDIKIGDPQQILSKELTTDGKEKVVWLYEAVGRPKTKSLQPKDKLMIEQVYQAKRANNPPYLIIFLNGKVANITKQQP